MERLDWLLAQLPRYADWGYQELYLHLEDAVAYPSLPSVARQDALSYRQMERLVATATRHGIGVVPIVNLLGHTQYLIKTPELRDLNELRAADGLPLPQGQICPLHPRTLEVAEALLRDMRPFCTTGKVHVGLDESFHLGKCPRCQEEVARIGLGGHFARHVNRLHQLVSRLDLKMGLWADMLYFVPEAIPQLPSGITAYDWYYYPFRKKPRVEFFNFAERDLHPALKRQGIHYYGCPMNGAFRHEPLPHFTDRLGNLLSWWQRCAATKADGMLITSWEPSRLAMELTTVVDAAAASLWLEPHSTKPEEMLTRGFARVFGRKCARRAAHVALSSDKFPFSGYPRWQVNERWDTVSRRESLKGYHTEVAHFTRLAKASRRLPTPLRASVEFRHYLAVRDLFVRTAAREPAQPSATLRALTKRYEKALTTGLHAARILWTTTRDRRQYGPNERILANDAARLRAWLRGQPVFGGRWQLCYRVRNIAPAVQLVGVEQQQPDGTWRLLQSCHTIEFQAQAARPDGTLVREHAAPIIWDDQRQTLPQLRFILRGVGQVQLEDIELSAGRAYRRGQSGPRKLGRPVIKRGLPQLDWARNEAIRLLTWSET